METPSEKNFKLSKVKIGKGGGLDVHFETQEAIGNEVYTEKHHLESAKDVHPDLEQLFKDLRPIVGRIFNLTSFLSLIETPDFKATAKQKEFSRGFADDLLENIEVRGVSLSGEKDNVGVVITSVLTILKGQKTAINTSRIKFATENYGFEEQLENIIANIEKEAYLFLFKGKKAQLELFDGNGDAAENTWPGDDESETETPELFDDAESDEGDDDENY